MTFGQTIRTQRRQADLTQEQLAQLLNISPQAVSRWETDMAMPDISLLPPLASLFKVTTDYLLGVDDYQREARRAEINEEFQEYWKKEDKEKNYHAALQAVAEYPGEMAYLEWLASAEFYLALTRKGEAFENGLSQAVMYYQTVLEHTEDSRLRDQALSGIVLSLHNLGKRDEAKTYALLQNDEEKRDELLNQCLEGTELKKHSQKILDRKLKQLLFQLPVGQKSLEAYNAVEQIINLLFPDGDYLEYHDILQYNCINKAFLLCRDCQWEAVIEELKKARSHAEKMTAYTHAHTHIPDEDSLPHKAKASSRILHHTSAMFDQIEWEPFDEQPAATALEDFYTCLANNSCFDPLRSREEFQALLQ
ncbi:MAG: helix-turn-helix transcriptional regulator [Lachnospiraceae bacterium]|nr:helix-turn-helix transcriptional regulator [Lachnospiraceae bacterium]